MLKKVVSFLIVWILTMATFNNARASEFLDKHSLLSDLNAGQWDVIEDKLTVLQGNHLMTGLRLDQIRPLLMRLAGFTIGEYIGMATEIIPSQSRKKPYSHPTGFFIKVMSLKRRGLI